MAGKHQRTVSSAGTIRYTDENGNHIISIFLNGRISKKTERFVFWIEPDGTRCIADNYTMKYVVLDATEDMK